MIRADGQRRQDDIDRRLEAAWYTAALGRARRIPRLSRFLRRRRRGKQRPLAVAPAEVAPERAQRIALLSRGVTLSPIDPYARDQP